MDISIKHTDKNYRTSSHIRIPCACIIPWNQVGHRDTPVSKYKDNGMRGDNGKDDN
jgi:hypothetical protein